MGTSVDAIAAAAGVSRATVFTTFGTKAALLKAAYDAGFGAGDERTPLIKRPEAQPVLAERDAYRYLARYVEMITALYARVAPIYEVVRAAAAADPEVMPIWDTIIAERLSGSRRIVGHLVERGRLRQGLDLTSSADAIWVHNDPGTYHMLVHQRGWSPARYRSWLTDLLRREVL